MKSSSSCSTAALYVVTIITGGTSWYAAKLQLTDVSPVISLIYRFGCASILLLLIAVISRERLTHTWREHLSFAALGAFGFAVTFLMIYKATALITTGLIALTYSSVILFNSINTILFLRQSISWSVLVGAVVGLTGIILVFSPEFLNNEWNWTGFGYAIAATLTFSFANISAVQLQRKGVTVLPMTGISMGYGTIFLLSYAFLTKQTFDFDLSPAYATSLFYLILFPSVIGYTTYFAVVGRLGAERGAYTMLLVPLVALTISSVTEGYRPTIWAIIGTMMTLSGNYWVITNKHQPTTKTDT
ncbi:MULTISPECIES: DMT family transporter [Photorhabdus]|uniref:EamA family transporter n=2 Tax=Photorhabdus TaxID=29487 RepID=A0ABX0ATK2_9GAMM|nr:MULTISPECIES: EamA family transporter [Photorhabdus]MCC8372593.1 EamA family transporter [Photorhabdus bodei]MCC8465196.1 EamA family transporter [Photorhabdus bodei]MCT8351129.1 DMT family transporter [Photorhabdus kayaii]MDB6367209.1 EamA family transporter [Photorhabdus bodei]MDB6370560.1 EamA family transporter [Photorhabdus bodei]